MYLKLVGGAFHPVIHLGYGLEFGIPFVVAEALASIAVHENRMAPLITDDFWTPSDKPQNISDIIDDVSHDHRFDGIVKFTDDFKLGKLLSKNPEAVREYAKRWEVKETEEDVNEKLKELYENCILAYAATAQRPGNHKILLDFFLMHAVTSIMGISIILPYVSLKHRVKLLRIHFATVLAYYISRGIPKIYPNLLENYTSMALEAEPNPWLHIISCGLEPNLENHVVKVLRALMKAEVEYGGTPKNIFLRAAALTLEGHAAYGWNQQGIGWDEPWK